KKSHASAIHPTGLSRRSIAAGPLRASPDARNTQPCPPQRSGKSPPRRIPSVPLGSQLSRPFFRTPPPSFRTTAENIYLWAPEGLSPSIGEVFPRRHAGGDLRAGRRPIVVKSGHHTRLMGEPNLLRRARTFFENSDGARPKPRRENKFQAYESNTGSSMNCS